MRRRIVYASRTSSISTLLGTTAASVTTQPHCWSPLGAHLNHMAVHIMPLHIMYDCPLFFGNWEEKKHSMSIAIDNTTFNVSSKYSLKPRYMNSVFNVVISEDTHWAQSCSTVDVPWWFHQPLIKDCQCLKMHAFNKIWNLDLSRVQNWNQFRDWHHSTLHKWIVLKQ